MKISIITISKNDHVGLERTITSVISQVHQPFEHIIVEAGGDDISLNILKKYNKRISYVSETDSGIYNAMNKGIDISKGDYILFLNSGDHFVSESSLDFWVNKISNKKARIYFARILWHSTFNNDISVSDHNYIDQTWHLINDNFPHPATLYQKNLFIEFGKYSESYDIMSDYEFNLRLLIENKVKFHYTPIIVSTFYASGVSVNPETSSKRHIENTLIRKKYFNKNLLWAAKQNLFKKNTSFLNQLIIILLRSNLNRVY